MQVIEGFEIYLLIALVVMCIYFWLLKKCGIIKPKAASLANVPTNNISTLDVIPKATLMAGKRPEMVLPPPVEHFSSIEPEDYGDFDFLDEPDTDNLLLREAEKIVEKIQDTIKHIASNPPNPEEITSKLRSIINPYTLFNDTEYYGAINAYIALSVERDLGIKLSSDEIIALWN